MDKVEGFYTIGEILQSLYGDLSGGSPMADKKPNRTESQEMILLFGWSAAMSKGIPELESMYHVPNEGKRKPWTGARMKAEGLKKGVPDICLPVPRNGYHGLYIEMKSAGGKLRKEQKEWLERLGRNGYLAVTCHGFEEARDLILAYLQGTMSPWQTA